MVTAARIVQPPTCRATPAELTAVSQIPENRGARRNRIGDRSDASPFIHRGVTARVQPTDRRWTPSPAQRGALGPFKPWWTALLVFLRGWSASVTRRKEAQQALIMALCLLPAAAIGPRVVRRPMRRGTAADRGRRRPRPAWRGHRGHVAREHGRLAAIGGGIPAAVMSAADTAASPAPNYLPGDVRTARGGRGVYVRAERGRASAEPYRVQNNHNQSCDGAAQGGRGGCGRRRAGGGAGGTRACACGGEIRAERAS